jgi:haloalkane dehalogenase
MVSTVNSVEYPFPSYWLELEGARMHYVDEGARDAPPVVMVHGNPTWSFYYRRLIQALKESHRVIAPDHVGCGLSDKPQDYPYTLAQHIANLEQLLTSLELTDITLVVHDWGGPIGMGYATRRPETIRRLVLFNTAAFYVDAVPWVLKLARSPVIGALLVRGFNAFARGALRWGTSQPERFTPAIRAGFLAPYDSWRHRVAVYRFVQDIPVSRSHPSRATLDQIEARLSRLRDHPALILWGADDFVFTTEDILPQWRRHLPQADVHVLENAGHYVVEDAYERILPKLKDFLGE